MKKKLLGSVLRIERTSIHDGEGLRTVLFLKGCPLRCAWCSTPESWRSNPEKGYARDLCTGCGICVRSCPSGALSLSEQDGKVHTDAAKCNNCFTCVAKCPRRAHKGYGTLMTVDEAVREIAKDEIFFFHSGGGVTISGGEALRQSDYVAEVLRQCKRQGIHTAMETSFYSPWENIEKVLPLLNVLYVDIKHGKDLHKRWVGFDNQIILENLKKTDESKYQLEMNVRIPVIPGVNDSDATLSEIAGFCRSLKKLKEIELLPYHRLGMETYKNLSIEYRLKNLVSPSQEQIMDRAQYLVQQNPGVPIKVGGGLNTVVLPAD